MPHRPTIKLVAPARFITQATLDLTTDYLTEQGFDLVVSPLCRTEHHQLAGSDEARADDFVRTWNDEDVDLVWCARGGYGSARAVRALRGRLRPAGKILVGYSDITYLLAHVACNGLGTAIHGPMAIDLMQPDKRLSVDRLCASVRARDFACDIRHGTTVLRPGTATGTMIVGSLSILTRLIGTPDEPAWQGAILAIEDVDEYAYALDRMILHLAEAGVLDRVAGLLLGSFTNIKDGDIPFGSTVAEMALRHLGGRDIPVVADVPFGHGPRNVPMVFGTAGTIRADGDTAEITVAGETQHGG